MAILLICSVHSLWLRSYEPIVGIELKFNNYITTFGKNYVDQEEFDFRLGAYQENLKQIEKLNRDHKDEAEYGETRFADWTKDEFNSILALAPPNQKDIMKSANLVTETASVQESL